jgi:hypothetical protein
LLSGVLIIGFLCFFDDHVGAKVHFVLRELFLLFVVLPLSNVIVSSHRSLTVLAFVSFAVCSAAATTALDEEVDLFHQTDDSFSPTLPKKNKIVVPLKKKAHLTTRRTTARAPKKFSITARTEEKETQEPVIVHVPHVEEHDEVHAVVSPTAIGVIGEGIVERKPNLAVVTVEISTKRTSTKVLTLDK